MVDTDSSTPSQANRALWRLSGGCLAYWSNRIIAKRLGPAQPRAIAWKGAGGRAIVSHARHENFSRTCWVTNNCRGTTSSVSVTSSPTFDRLVLPQHGHDVGAGCTILWRGK